MNKTRMLAVGLGLVVAGCGVSDADLDEASGLDQVDSELGTTVQSYVVARHDTRRCVAPACGGYWVHDVNRVNLREVYVSGLDLSQVQVDAATADAVRNAPNGEVVLKGRLGRAEPRFGTRQFVVTGAWRGMPGVTVGASDTFFSVEEATITCIAAPCPSLKATRLNSAQSRLLTGLDVAHAAKPHVQEEWLTARLALRGALAAGTIVQRPSTQGPAPETLLDASQVFVRLPERIGPCPMRPIQMCPPGQIVKMSRSADRCLLPSGCTTPGMCTAEVPSCESGYTVVEWTGPGACTQWACDPSFVQ